MGTPTLKTKELGGRLRVLIPDAAGPFDASESRLPAPLWEHELRGWGGGGNKGHPKIGVGILTASIPL